MAFADSIALLSGRTLKPTIMALDAVASDVAVRDTAHTAVYNLT